MPTAPDHLPARRRAARVWLWTERLLWGAGSAALAVSMLASGASAIGARQDLRRFADLKAAGSSPDLRLWSSERVRAWRETLDETASPLAVLRIPKIALEVAVLEGTSEWALNRGVGLIEDTPRPGTAGNAGIAGHRDGFFRGLKDVGVGDLIELETLTSVDRYRIERTWIVNPEDVSVLDPTTSPSLTLVTCYPFYFVGEAPQRFIVRAVRVPAQRSGGGSE
jgi:sortase A